jgi:hypothetical protein
VYALLRRLDSARIHYTLARVRDDTIMVEVVVPGRHYEIEVFASGDVEVEVFRSDGHLGGPEMLDELFENYSDRST